MRTIIKQERLVSGERNALPASRQLARTQGIKELNGSQGGWRRQRHLPQAARGHVIRLLTRFDPKFGIELKSSNDADAYSGKDEAGDLFSLTPVEHPSAISYVASCSADRQLVYVSPQVSRLGFASEDLLDKPDLRIRQVHQDDFPMLEEAWNRSRQQGRKVSCHYRMYDSQGRIRWFHDEASVVCDEHGEPRYIKGVMLDITDKKLMEAELEGHRYNLERNVEQRTAVLSRRLELLESCNASLCSRLSAARMEIAELKKQIERLAPAEGEAQLA